MTDYSDTPTDLDFELYDSIQSPEGRRAFILAKIPSLTDAQLAEFERNSEPHAYLEFNSDDLEWLIFALVIADRENPIVSDAYKRMRRYIFDQIEPYRGAKP